MARPPDRDTPRRGELRFRDCAYDPPLEPLLDANGEPHTFYTWYIDWLERDPLRVHRRGPGAEPANSPTVYRTDRGLWIIQGIVVDDPEALAVLRLPEGETAVEIPDHMLRLLQRQEDDGADQ